jgi:hypothetical protein
LIHCFICFITNKEVTVSSLNVFIFIRFLLILRFITNSFVLIYY